MLYFKIKNFYDNDQTLLAGRPLIGRHAAIRNGYLPPRIYRRVLRVVSGNPPKFCSIDNPSGDESFLNCRCADSIALVV